MGSRFVRRVRTASGAVAVQVVTKEGGVVVEVEHIGSAHTDAELSLLVGAAGEQLHVGQGALDLGELDQAQISTRDVADWTRPEVDDSADPQVGRPRSVAGGGKVVRTSALTLWNVLADTYTRLGFDVVGDEAFRALVLARIIEPTSKADTIRVLDEVGVPGPSLRTIFRTLGRSIARDYRGTIAKACMSHTARSGAAALVMYDVTTLYFEAVKEDDLRKVGMSKERRVDPQVQVGLLVDPSGFPLEVHCFEGNMAETKTLIPVLRAFQERHGVADMVVVADAGMLSASNLNALEDAGFSFVVGSRISKAPYDLADYFERHGNYIPPGEEGHILESQRTMGKGKDARERRVVYQWSMKRQRHDDRAINAMVERAEKVAAGTRPLKKDRFVSLAGKEPGVHWGLVERARQLAGLKGYVTNLPTTKMAGTEVIAAYHDLWQVEKSFRMAKGDLRARPVFHHQRDSIEAHLTIVFAALAISRHLQDVTGVSIKKIVRALKSVRSATVRINGKEITLEPEIPGAAAELLTSLGHAGH